MTGTELTNRKCKIDDVLNGVTLAMLKEAPLNPTVRSHIHALTKRPIPNELETYDQIKDWIEVNFDQEHFTKTEETRPNTRATFPIMVSCSEVETGTCRYSCCNVGRGRYTPTWDQILETTVQVLEAGGGLNKVAQELKSWAEDNAIENPPDMGIDDNGFEYEGHNTNDTHDFEAGASLENIKSHLEQWLRVNRPATLALLVNNDRRAQ